MDVGSSNGSSVTSLDLNYDADEAIESIEIPLSPVLSNSKINKRLLRNQKINRQSSKVKLANKFNEDVYSTVQNEMLNQYKNTTISHMTAVNVYEEQRKQYYDLLCDDGVENIYKNSHSVPTPTTYNSTPESSLKTIRNVMNDDGIETCVNYHFNEDLKTLNFRTAGGRNIELSDESLQNSSALFDDIINSDEKVSDPSVGYNTIFKRPGDVKKKLSKIPVLNQAKNTYRKTKAMRSTYEQFKINMSDMTMTQTHVDTMEEFVDSNDTSNDLITHENDSSGTLHENLYGDSMNKIFSNKKFVEFSSSSVENTTYSDTIVETVDLFAKHTKSKSKEKSNILLSNDSADITIEDWTETKSVPKQKTDSRSHTKTMETIQEQVPKSCCVQKFNLTPSKNVVIVSLPPTLNECVSSNRNVVELHRNSNFAHSNDSVQQVDLIPEHDVEQKKKHVKKSIGDGFAGFTPEEQQHSRRMFAKVCEVVKRSEQALEEVKLKKLEKKHLKEKKSRRLKNHVDKCSLNSTAKTVIDDSKTNSRDKSKHRKPKTKDTDSGKESRYASSRKTKSRNASVSRNIIPEPTNKQSDNVGEGVLNQEPTKLVTYDQLSLIAQEACKKINKKRKETQNVTAEYGTEQIGSDDTKKTIEVSPNQKKFKIQIDCNSKFRINISCNQENEESKNACEPIVEIHDQEILTDDEARCEKEEPGDKNNLLEIDNATGQEPKGKHLQKFMNKAHKIYRDIKKPSEFEPESKDTFDENSRIPEKIPKRSRKPSEGINTGSEPNYEDSQEMTLKPDYEDFCGLKVMAPTQSSADEIVKTSKQLNRETFDDKNVEMKHVGGFKTAGGKDLKISKKAVDNAKKMYDNVQDNSEGAFEKKEYPLISSIKDMEKNLNKAKKLFENLAELKENTNEVSPKLSPKRDHLSKEEKAERVLNKMRKLYESLNNEDSLEDLTESIVEIENLHNIVSETVNDTEKCLDSDEIYRDSYEKKVPNIQAYSSTGFVSASGKDVKISDNAMAKALKMYANAAKDAEHDLKADKSDSSSSSFKSASGKVFQVSEEALGKARKIYEQISDVKEDLNTETSNVTKPGFRRSLGKDFGVPQSAKPTKLHAPICEETSDFLPVGNMGFMSASGKNVKISEKSLKRARKMYESIEKEPDELDQKQRSPIEDTNRAKNVHHHVKSAPPVPNIAGSANTTQKIKAIFDELSLEAGDFESSSKSEEKPDKVGHDNIPQELRCHNPNPSSLCMGDYIQSNDSIIHESTSYTENKHRKGLTPAVNKVSKKAFELLEDVVDTVDHALHTIDERLKRPRLSISRRRLGVSRHKQINISSEKLERAKLLFKDDFNESVKNIRNISTPVKLIKPTYSSTPILNKATSITTSSAISPVKNRRSPPSRNSAKNLFPSSVVLREQTKGNIADWSMNIDQEMENMRLQIKIFEERKGYLVYQKEALENNKNATISPQAGVLIRRKEHVKLHLNDLRVRTTTDGISEGILDITPKNADLVHFAFEKSNNDLLHAYTSLDGALIIPNTRNLIGLTEVEVAFKIMPGVDLKLIPPGWIHHHYKLIVWKLASYERFLSIHLKGCLNIENVLQQLKYRYDREIDKAERPALRKILEKDDIPQKRMILCVSDIKETETGKELELCDGWYCLKTIIDDALTTQIMKGKVTVGTKLITSGAQIINCDGCHPLEVPDFVRLKISCNSTRRAPWFAKLGYQTQAGPLLVPLHSIKPDGGMIGCVKLYVARIYPLRFMEQIEDAKIWRNNKAEEKRAREFENERLNKMEKVHYDVQKQYEREKYQERKNNPLDCSKLSSNEILNIHCPKVLLGLLESSNDPDSVMEHMSASQRGKVLDYRQTVCVERQIEVTRKIAEAMEKLKLAKRKVVSILKLLVVDATSDSDKAYQFCVWNPTEDDLSMLREYNVYLVYNILPRFNGELFSSNKTFFKSDKKMSYNKFKRQLYPIAMLRDNNYHPSFNEFDTVGIVVHVDIMDSEQSLWLADTTANLLFVKVKDGPKFCRLLDDIMKGDVVSILNVIYSQPHADYAVAYANQFTIVTKSMQNYLRESIDTFKMQLPKDLAKFLNNCIANVEKFPRNTEPKTEKFDTAYMQCGLKLTPSLKAVVDDSSEDGSVIPDSLTATDIAMSLIDMDKLM